VDEPTVPAVLTFGALSQADQSAKSALAVAQSAYTAAQAEEQKSDSAFAAAILAQGEGYTEPNADGLTFTTYTVDTAGRLQAPVVTVGPNTPVPTPAS
jgi:hypothetical protein